MLASLAVAGCAPRSRITLVQPNAPPSQQQLQLGSDWTYWQSDAERRFCLLAFPLPGAKNGPRDFHVYVDMPVGEGTSAIAPEADSGARGFLVQEVGQMRGKTEFSAGTLRWKPAWLAPQKGRLELDITCQDGTRITGAATLQRNDAELRTFARRFAADIAALQHAPATVTDAAPAVEGAESQRRGAAQTGSP